jgi:hypothetical protein
MDYHLYKDNNKYYLITCKAINYNIAVEFDTFKNLFISNDKLANLSLIEFNEENLKMFDLYDFILIDDKIYRFNNWLDVFEYFKNRKLFKNNLL